MQARETQPPQFRPCLPGPGGSPAKRSRRAEQPIASGILGAKNLYQCRRQAPISACPSRKIDGSAGSRCYLRPQKRTQRRSMRPSQPSEDEPATPKTTRSPAPPHHVPPLRYRERDGTSNKPNQFNDLDIKWQFFDTTSKKGTFRDILGDWPRSPAR